MVLKTRADWRQAREIVKRWLMSNGFKSIHLAEEARVNRSIISRFLNGKKLDADSAIKIYYVIEQGINDTDKRTFLKVAGLYMLISPLVDSPHGIRILQEGEKKDNSFESGTRLITLAMENSRQSWEVAIPLFFQAEKILGFALCQSAYAACEAMQMLINLGDYEKAEQHAVRVQNQYSTILDPETKVRLYRLRGWITYYKGELLQSKEWFFKCIEISKATGIEKLADEPNHFLGRVYLGLNQFREAETHFDASYKARMERGSRGSVAFEFFRKSQLLQSQRSFSDAQKWRNKAKQLFRGNLAVMHINIEEARLASFDGNIKLSKIKAEEALTVWASIKYAKGMAEAAGALATAELQQEKWLKALEYSVLALCLHPFDAHRTSRSLWENIEWLKSKVSRRELDNLKDAVIEHKASYSYLNLLSISRGEAIQVILNRLK